MIGQLTAACQLLRSGQRLVAAARRHFNSEISATWPPGIRQSLEEQQIRTPTIIQERTLPIVMQNKDLVGIARTGSGKTLAFVLPALVKILGNRDKSKQTQTNQDEAPREWTNKLPTCLILAPTRELANQTSSVLNKFRSLGIRNISLVGGSSRSEQLRRLNYADHDVYVATPGRLNDLLETQAVDLSQINYLVLDEADRMLDMGFEPQIRRIIEKTPKDRQTVMWSATWPEEIQSLAAEFMKDYEYIAVDSEKLKANPNIQQIIKTCEPIDKARLLSEHLKKFSEESEDPRILIFVNTKRFADMLLIQLMRNRTKAIAMHGDRSQKQRDDALRLFKDRLCNVMIATDVAARGLDISDISHVVNYDFPTNIEDYIHRIGRTARHEKKGVSLSFFTTHDASLARKLLSILRETGQEVPDDLTEIANNQHLYKQQARDGSKRRPRRNDFYSTGGRGHAYSPHRDRYGPSRYNDRRSRSYDDYGEEEEEDDYYDDRGGRRRTRSNMFDD